MSTRRIEKVAGELELGRSGPSAVSRMLASLDGEVDALRQTEFDAGSPVPYLWLDATYVKCRDDDSRVCSRATVTAIGAFMDGTRRFVGFDLVDTESYDSWQCCFVHLQCDLAARIRHKPDQGRAMRALSAVLRQGRRGLDARRLRRRRGPHRPDRPVRRNCSRTRWPIWRSTGNTGSGCAPTTCRNALTARTSDMPALCGSSPHASP